MSSLSTTHYMYKLDCSKIARSQWDIWDGQIAGRPSTGCKLFFTGKIVMHKNTIRLFVVCFKETYVGKLARFSVTNAHALRNGKVVINRNAMQQVCNIK